MNLPLEARPDREEVLNRAPLPDNEILKTQKWQDALALLRR
jgi:hypothetical protein